MKGMGTAQEQRREHVRRLLEVPASARKTASPHSWKVRLIDIGRGGVGFVTETAVEVGDEVVLSFLLPNRNAVTELLARIVYAAPLDRPGWYRIGARFAALSDETASDIVDFVTAPAQAG